MSNSFDNGKGLSAVTKYLLVLMSLNLLIQSLSFLERQYDLISLVPPGAAKEKYQNRPRKSTAAMTLRQY
jgi:hypothetical protein